MVMDYRACETSMACPRVFVACSGPIGSLLSLSGIDDKLPVESLRSDIMDLYSRLPSMNSCAVIPGGSSLATNERALYSKLLSCEGHSPEGFT